MRGGSAKLAHLSQSSASLPESASPDLVNEAALSILEDSLGRDVFAPMISNFMENMLRYRDELRGAVSSGDLIEAKRVAHALKGLCAQFGAPRVSEGARLLEYQAKDAAEMRPLLLQVEAAIAETNAAFTARHTQAVHVKAS
jgi:HPt (histidine-containing phosphotransfer) domain-containing protein